MKFSKRVASLILAISVFVSIAVPYTSMAAVTIEPWMNSWKTADKLIYGECPDAFINKDDAFKANVGNGIKRTMRLLETSTKEKPNRVKILFYGQSLSMAQNGYTHSLIAWLREKYPTAIIEYDNLAIGGYNSNILSTLAQTDFKSAYPDLIIMHDLVDSWDTYEKTIKIIRENTTSEIMLFNDQPRGRNVSFQSIQDVTKFQYLVDTYGVEYCDIYTPWKHYYETYMKPQGFLAHHLLIQDDGLYVHFNEQGQRLVLELLKQYFVYKEDLNADTEVCKTYVVGKDVKWKNGKLTLNAKGNRFVIVPKKGKKYNTASITVDGKKPSEFLSAYYNTRIFGSSTAGGGLLNLSLLNAPRRNLNYTITFSNVQAANNHLKAADYSVNTEKGSNLGTGNMDNVFTASNGLFTFDPKEFNFSSALKRSDMGAPSNGSIMYWQFKLNGQDIYMDNVAEPVVAVSHISNKEHTLQLKATNKKELPGIKEIKVYSPKYGAETTDTYVKPVQKEVIKTTYKTSKAVKMLKKAKAKSKVVFKKVPKNKKVTLVSTKTFGKKYYKVKYKKKTGFILKSSIKYTRSITLS